MWASWSVGIVLVHNTGRGIPKEEKMEVEEACVEDKGDRSEKATSKKHRAPLNVFGKVPTISRLGRVYVAVRVHVLVM